MFVLPSLISLTLAEGVHARNVHVELSSLVSLSAFRGEYGNISLRHKQNLVAVTFEASSVANIDINASGLAGNQGLSVSSAQLE
ncbi:hypothetical protein B0O99DRAFT_626175 [Bisporella sp. PMI_857]|nr:hypothetical protein B0O99DRAFT_626175 [Bisporella sp. PMI_857]